MGGILLQSWLLKKQMQERELLLHADLGLLRLGSVEGEHGLLLLGLALRVSSRLLALGIRGLLLRLTWILWLGLAVQLLVGSSQLVLESGMAIRAGRCRRIGHRYGGSRGQRGWRAQDGVVAVSLGTNKPVLGHRSRRGF